jgi:Fe-S-cluster containining protein
MKDSPREGAIRSADRMVLRVVDATMARAASDAGERLACRPGCTECCIGPFPITRLDAFRLREGLAFLASSDPARAQSVLDRARRAVSIMESGFPGDRVTGRLGPDDAAEERFAARCADLPCPALDPSAGTCDLYAFRPLSCRTFGPPVRIGGADLPPCRLCFAGSTTAEIESCRVEPDPEGAEESALTLFGERPEDDWETLVAYALLLTESHLSR